MFKTVRFPIKGTYYYAADLAMESDLIQQDTVLTLKQEPENAYDRHAIQIWLPTDFQPSSNLPPPLSPPSNNPSHIALNPYPGLLLGYVPRLLAPTIGQYFENFSTLNTQVIHKAKLGKMIEIDCQIELQVNWIQNTQLQLTAFWVRQFYRMQKFLHSLRHSN